MGKKNSNKTFPELSTKRDDAAWFSHFLLKGVVVVVAAAAAAVKALNSRHRAVIWSSVFV